MLKQLEQSISSELKTSVNIKEHSKFNLKASDFLEISNSVSAESINKAITSFYKNQGYKINKYPSGLIEAKKSKEEIWIDVLKTPNSYLISVRKLF